LPATGLGAGGLFAIARQLAPSIGMSGSGWGLLGVEVCRFAATGLAVGLWLIASFGFIRRLANLIRFMFAKAILALCYIFVKTQDVVDIAYSYWCWRLFLGDAFGYFRYVRKD